jgi:hypothetical protein
MDRKVRLFGFLSLLTGFANAPLPAEESAAKDTLGAVGQEAARPQVASVFGTQTNILQIPASSFMPRGAGTIIGDCVTGYVYRSAGATSEFAWATVTLPSGVDLDFLDLYSCDVHAAYNLTATLRGYTGWDNSNINETNLISVSSSGSTGCGYAFAPGSIVRPDGFPIGFDHTINNDVRYNGGYQYSIIVNSPVTDFTLCFKGVDIWYHRQVSPAPGTASFTDVPTSHQFFRFIEALYHSGITSGCQASPAKYCPGSAITRGEMAVFLAKALGLHFPN